MAKFYVLSGDIRWVGNAENEVDACICAIKATQASHDTFSSGLFFYVDERGYRKGGLEVSSYSSVEECSKTIPSDFIARKMQ